MKQIKADYDITELCTAMLQLKSEDECKSFLQDLLSPSERRAMAQRYEVSKMLINDKVYSEIVETTGASTAIISRMNRALRDGDGVLVNIIEKLSEEK